MKDKKSSKFTKGKVGFAIAFIGTAIMIITIVMIALRTDILCGMAISGFFLAVIGIAMRITDGIKNDKGV